MSWSMGVEQGCRGCPSRCRCAVGVRRWASSTPGPTAGGDCESTSGHRINRISTPIRQGIYRARDVRGWRRASSADPRAADATAVEPEFTPLAGANPGASSSAMQGGSRVVAAAVAVELAGWSIRGGGGHVFEAPVANSQRAAERSGRRG